MDLMSQFQSQVQNRYTPKAGDTDSQRLDSSDLKAVSTSCPSFLVSDSLEPHDRVECGR